MVYERRGGVAIDQDQAGFRIVNIRHSGGTPRGGSVSMRYCGRGRGEVLKTIGIEMNTILVGLIQDKPCL